MEEGLSRVPARVDCVETPQSLSRDSGGSVQGTDRANEAQRVGCLQRCFTEFELAAFAL